MTTYNFLDALFQNHNMYLDILIGYDDYLIYEEILSNDTDRIEV